MKRILITGSTGNIGHEVIRYLLDSNTPHSIIAGVRNIHKAQSEFKEYPQLQFVRFDFEDPDSFDQALENIDCVFLLRPPHIADVHKYFTPLVGKLHDKNIRQVVFLSVQGAEKSSVIPHNKIERLIRASNIDFVFLRPSYFMQNLTTTLRKDIVEKRRILLPAGDAKFNWIDIECIGEAAAEILLHFENYKNRAIVLTGYENLDFNQVADLLTETVGLKIRFDNSNLLRFYWIKKKDGYAAGIIIVMMLLHFLPRFQPEPTISTFYEELTGKKPTTLKDFIVRERNKLS